MNPGFEDFVNDLKREALLEETFVGGPAPAPSEKGQQSDDGGFVVISSFHDELETIGSNDESAEGSAPRTGPAEIQDAPERPEAVASESPSSGASDSKRSPAFDNLVRRRAVDRVNGLEMVDGVIRAAEAGAQGAPAESFEVFHVKRALQELVEALESSSDEKVTVAASNFEEEVLRWFSGLAARDNKLSPSELRRHCENAKPALNGKALSALAHFYRQCPASSASREKFEIVIGRIFTRETGPDRRTTVFGREVVERRIAAMYEEWGDPRFLCDEPSESVESTVRNLTLLMREAEFSETFEDLVADDFLRRFRMLKEATGDDLFSPSLLACVVEANVLVGNRFVELLEQEKKRNELEAVGARFSFVCDENISKLTSSSLKSAERFCRQFSRLAPSPTAIAAEQRRRSQAGLIKRIRMMFTISPWLFAVLLVVVLSAVALYFGVKSVLLDGAEVSVERRVNLGDTRFRPFMADAKISGETFMATVSPAWEGLDAERKRQLVGDLLFIGRDKGFRFVRLTDPLGNVVVKGADGSVDFGDAEPAGLPEGDR